MQVYNQRPAALVPDYIDDITADLDSLAFEKILLSILAPIRTPLLATNPNVEIRDDNGNLIDDAVITAMLLRCCQDTVDPDAEDFCRELFSKTLANYDKALAAEAIFIAQANAQAKCPPPSGNILYITEDLKDACRQYLADPVKKLAFLQCTEAFVIPERHLAIHFTAKPVFDDYKNFVQAFAQAHAANMTPDDLQKVKDFSAIDLEIIEGVVLRASDIDGHDAYSFERVLVRATLEYLKTTNDAGLIAPYFSELIVPRNLLFLDVEQIARCSRAKLDRLLSDIHSAMTQKVTPVTLRHIAKMTALSSNRRKIQSQLQNAQTAAAGGPAGRRSLFKFGGSAPGPATLSKHIAALVAKQVNVASSENYAKTVRMSYQRQNRRDPDNFNLKGKSIAMTYKPDIHIYLDTSGSISEENYKAAIMTCIWLAKRLDINLYFSSFSHILSESVKLRTRGLSPAGIYREFQRIPKVTGGTDYKNVWEYINASPKRRRELSLLITDFEYSPPNERLVHPDKLWYVPIDVSPRGWNGIVREAQRFCRAMYAIDGNIRKKLLM